MRAKYFSQFTFAHKTEIKNLACATHNLVISQSQLQIPCFIHCLFCRSKYFRGKRLHGDYDIRVEQAEFKELSLTANAETGTTVSMAVFRNGTKVVRSFRPDFVLIRQNLRDACEDNKNLLLGFKFGGVPSINSLHAIYNFQVGRVFFFSLNIERAGTITASVKLCLCIL